MTGAPLELGTNQRVHNYFFSFGNTKCIALILPRVQCKDGVDRDQDSVVVFVSSFLHCTACYYLGFIFLLSFQNAKVLIADKKILELVTFETTAQFEIQDKYIGILSSSMFVGMMFGAMFWGMLADAYGRKQAFNLTLIVTTLFGVAASFANSYWLLCLLILGLGFGVSGTFGQCCMGTKNDGVAPGSNTVDAYLGILVFLLGRREHAGKNMTFFDILCAPLCGIFFLFARLYFCGCALINLRGLPLRDISFFVYSPPVLAFLC